MNAFMLALKTALERRGITKIEWIQHSSYMTIGGVEFWFERRGRYSVKVEGSPTFRISNPQTINKVINHILEIYPERLKKQKERAERQKKYAEATTINESVSHSNIRISYDSEGFYFVFRDNDKRTIMAAIDCLNDYGFCDTYKPTVDEEGFFERTIRNTWKQLTDEQRKVFIEEMTTDAVEEEDTPKE